MTINADQLQNSARHFSNEVTQIQMTTEPGFVSVLIISILDPDMLDSGPRFPKISAQKHTKLAANFVCFGPKISVQSPAFPSPKSRPRVQRFQNALLIIDLH